MLAIAEYSRRAVPALGSDLNSKLNQIAASVDHDALTEATAEMRRELKTWADRAFEHHSDNQRELREIVGAVAKAAETISEKGDQYAREIGDLNTKLRSIAELDDVAVIRRSIVESTEALRGCVDRMAEDGKASVARLTAEVKEYRTRLEESEKVAVTDPLTGLPNRRAFEKKLQARIAAHQAFCLIMLDLNGFKEVNDAHGHLAGDDLLKQFGSELKGQFSALDLVARWGGDEFAVIAACALAEARDRVERIKRWVFGEYKLTAVDPPIKVKTSASVGAVEWQAGENAAQLLSRADREVYKSKPANARSSRGFGAKSP